MKRPLKIGLGVVGAVVLLIVVAVAIVAARLDAIVESVVEKEGTNQLDLQTALDEANVSLLGGNVTLSGLTIANPEGYRAEHLFEMGRVSADASLGGLRGDPVRIGGIAIDSPRLVIERGSAEGITDQLRLNLRELLEHLSEQAEAEPAADEAEPTRLLIDRLTVTNARVVVRPNLPELDEAYELTLPSVTLEQIGTAEEAQNGAELGRVVGEVVMALAARAAEDESLPPELRDVLSGDLRQVAERYARELGGQAVDDLRERLGDAAGGAAGDALDAAIEGDTDRLRDAVGEGAREVAGRRLGDLFGGDEDDAAPDEGGGN